MPVGNQSHDDKKTYIIIGLIFLIFVLCGTIGYLLLSNDKDVQAVADVQAVELPSTKPETITTPETTTPVAVSTEKDNSSAPIPIQLDELSNKDTSETFIRYDEFSDKDTAAPFITLKDSFDSQIAALATDVNNHLGSNANYQNAYHLIEMAEQIVRNIRDTRDRLQQTRFNDESLKNQIITVLDAELIRADGIREGVQSSYDGGDWHAGFRRGYNGKIQFDNENAVLMNMVR